MTRAEATAAVRQRLVAAAIEQLAEHGMRDLTHRKVERRAAVAQGSAKYHFGNLDGLVEAVLARMVEVELASVMVVSPALLAEADETGSVPDAVWQQARAVCAEILARPSLVRARFELYLHAVDRPPLQDAIRRGRDQFVARTAAALLGDRPDSSDGAAGGVAGAVGVAGRGEAADAGARMVLALVDGMLLHQLSAPDGPEAVEQLARQLVTTAAAARAMAAPAS